MNISGITVALLSIALLSACGSEEEAGACRDSPVKGSWSTADGGETLTFGSNCSFKDSSCNYSGTYPPVTASSGSVLVTIESSRDGDDCLPVGQVTCGYSVQGEVLGLACGSGSGSYFRD